MRDLLVLHLMIAAVLMSCAAPLLVETRAAPPVVSDAVVEVELAAIDSLPSWKAPESSLVDLWIPPAPPDEQPAGLNHCAITYAEPLELNVIANVLPQQDKTNDWLRGQSRLEGAVLDLNDSFWIRESE